MKVELVSFRNWVGMSKIKEEERVLRISNHAFFFKEFTGKSVEDVIKFGNLKEALEKRLPTSYWALTFAVKRDEETSPRPKWSVSVRGKLLQELHRIFYDHNSQKNLKLVVKEVGIYQDGLVLKRIERVATDMQPNRNDGEDDLNKHFCYFQREIDVEQTTIQNIEWSLSLQLLIEDDIQLMHEDFLMGRSSFLEKMLKRKILCDFELVALNGSRHPCHKAVLTAWSRVFEVKDRRAQLPLTKLALGLSEDGVLALLEYLYCTREIRGAIKSFEIVSELEQFSRSFDIENLGRAMRQLMGYMNMMKT